MNETPLCLSCVKTQQHGKSIHENMKTFKCSQCEFETARKDSLKRHIESIHENMKTFKCSQCEYETSRKDNFKRHQKIKHGGPAPPNGATTHDITPISWIELVQLYKCQFV